MQVTTVHPAIPPGGLSALGEVVLNEQNQRLLDEAVALADGPAVWRKRKAAEARDLLALSQIAFRFKVQFVELRQALRALVFLQVPVACRPNEQGDLPIIPQAVLGITYPQEALWKQLPGYAFIQVLAPQGVWHANVAWDPVQPLCLGAQLPAGIRVKELVLMAYGALSMQTVQVDELDAAGVMNPEAAVWWQRNMSRIPLSRTPFLSNEA